MFFLAELVKLAGFLSCLAQFRSSRLNLARIDVRLLIVTPDVLLYLLYF